MALTNEKKVQQKSKTHFDNDNKTKLLFYVCKITLLLCPQMIDKLVHQKKVFDVPIPIPKSKFELVKLGFEMGV